jgi:hypothetical protein
MVILMSRMRIVMQITIQLHLMTELQQNLRSTRHLDGLSTLPLMIVEVSVAEKKNRREFEVESTKARVFAKRVGRVGELVRIGAA